MALSEFEIIDCYFAHATAERDDVRVGIGDDAALVAVRAGHDLAVATDTLIAGVHFPAEATAEDIGYRALAVNLSDLAAMGAEPAWATLALTLPAADETWLNGFARGFAKLADRFGVQLIGGDTTRGPLSITVTVHGWVPAGTGLLRSGAKGGDAVLVSGTLGDASLALTLLQAGELDASTHRDFLSERFFRPPPRVALGEHLRGRAHSAIDISDGLVADLGHILERSLAGAVIEADRLPYSMAMRECTSPAQARQHALAGGDDYELCFTIPRQLEQEISLWGSTHDLRLTRIGYIVTEPGLRVVDAQGHEVSLESCGYAHF
jgi:thiamine-monophosphate kinase